MSNREEQSDTLPVLCNIFAYKVFLYKCRCESHTYNKADYISSWNLPVEYFNAYLLGPTFSAFPLHHKANMRLLYYTGRRGDNKEERAFWITITIVSFNAMHLAIWNTYRYFYFGTQ